MTVVPGDHPEAVAELIDIAERIAAAVLAVINDDMAGARHVLNGAPVDPLTMLLLRLVVRVGREGVGEEALVRGLLEWPQNVIDDMRGRQ